MQVFVYFNLKTKRWSIAEVSGNGRGKLIRHADQVTLTNARFVVSEAMRQTVLRKQERSVHAGVIGTLTDYSAPPSNAAEVSYNPYRSAQFHDRATGEVVTTYANVSFGTGDKYARGW